jgi:hypothetical protein
MHLLLLLFLLLFLDGSDALTWFSAQKRPRVSNKCGMRPDGCSPHFVLTKDAASERLTTPVGRIPAGNYLVGEAVTPMTIEFVSRRGCTRSSQPWPSMPFTQTRPFHHHSSTKYSVRFGFAIENLGNASLAKYQHRTGRTPKESCKFLLEIPSSVILRLYCKFKFV